MKVENGRFIIDTERLWLLPLTADESRLYAESGDALARSLGVSYGGEEVEKIFSSILEASANIMESKNYLFPYQAFWVLITKETDTIIGSSDFKTAPDENGITEIGYGLGSKFTHKGYMTECVTAMCKWAFESGEVSEVIAETDRDNIASINVLKRCGFHQVESPNEYFRWSIKKQ